MTSFVPDFLQESRKIGDQLKADPRWRGILEHEAEARVLVYQKIGYPRRSYFPRTVQTAAQYVYLGRVAMARGSILCNHSTQNLAWYVRTGAAFLHNPARVYDGELIVPRDELDE